MKIEEHKEIIDLTIILQPNEIDRFLNVIEFALDYEAEHKNSLLESEKNMANELIEVCKKSLD